VNRKRTAINLIISADKILSKDLTIVFARYLLRMQVTTVSLRWSFPSTI